MAFDAGSIIAKVKADISEFKAGMQEAQQHASGFQNALGGLANVGAAVVKGLAVAGAATAAFGALSLKEYTKSEDAVTQLQAALTSTHEAAGLYIDDLIDQAAALQKVTKFSDEQVESAQALLLTFTNIKGVTFQKTTQTVLDMATALKMDATGAAQILGKALNAPTEGLSALSRIGIRFSDSQQTMIANFEKTGQTAKAQDVILQELNKRFGGSAVAAGSTLSGQLARLKNIWSDLMENIGMHLANTIKPMIDVFLAWIDSMGGAWGIYDKINTAVMNLGAQIATFLTPAIKALKEAWDFLKPSIDLLWANIQVNLIPALRNLWENFIKPLLPGLGVALVAAIFILINALTIAINVISIIANVLGDLGHIVQDTTSDIAVWFYLLPGKIADGLKGLWGAITKPFSDAFNWVKNEANKLKDTVAGALNPLQRHSPSLVDLLNKGVPEIPKIYGRAFDQINGMAAGLRPTLIGATAGATPGGNVTTNIYGNINNGSNADRDAFFRRLTRNQELAAKGMATKPGSVG
jgi:hypothetical protein